MRLKLMFLLMIIFLAGCNAMGQTTMPNSVQEAQELNPQEHQQNETVPPKSIGSKTEQENSTTANGKVITESLESIQPSRIKIPAINVDTKIENVGLLDNGQMGVPESFETVGWYDRGPMPGERGNAVIAGHVDSKKGPAVFFYLKKLKAGDEVIVSDEKGKTLTFIVKDIKNYPTELSPVNEIFDYSFQRRLNLITCTGIYDPKTGNHSERLVVYTTIKSSR